MGRKPTGSKASHKRDFEVEQIDFLESYGEQFWTGVGTSVLYTEVLGKWIKRFGYAGLNPKNKKGFNPLELRLEEDIRALCNEERQQVLAWCEKAKLTICTVRLVFLKFGSGTN